MLHRRQLAYQLATVPLDRPGSAAWRTRAYLNSATSRARWARLARSSSNVVIDTSIRDQTLTTTSLPPSMAGRTDVYSCWSTPPAGSAPAAAHASTPTRPATPTPRPPPSPNAGAPPRPPPRPLPPRRHRRTRRGEGVRVVVQFMQQPGERRPQSRRVGRPPTQPAPHRRQRPPHPRGDPSSAPPRRPGQQRRTDHIGRIRPPGQHRSGQQHMRAPARTALRPPRNNLTAPTIRTEIVPHGPRSSPRPRRQHPRTTRARQLASTQHIIDLINIRTYREHGGASSTAQTALPMLAKDQREGRRLPDLITLAPHTKKGNPLRPPSQTSSPSTTRHPHPVLIRDGV